MKQAMIAAIAVVAAMTSCSKEASKPAAGSAASGSGSASASAYKPTEAECAATVKHLVKLRIESYPADLADHARQRTEAIAPDLERAYTKICVEQAFSKALIDCVNETKTAMDGSRCAPMFTDAQKEALKPIEHTLASAWQAKQNAAAGSGSAAASGSATDGH